MTIDARQISMRFAALSPDARRRFLQKLKENGVDFSSLPIAPAPRDRDLPISEAQRGLWLAWQRDTSSPAYNLGGVIAVEGRLDGGALERALAALAERHEPLRTTFGLDEAGEPAQRVRSEAAPRLVIRDLTDEAVSEAAAEALVRTPFNLETGPMLRLELHRIGDRSRLALALHHILADGESVGLLVQDLSALYEAEAAGGLGLPPLPLQFADHVHWRRDWLEAGEKERQLAFWRSALGDEHAPLELPFDRKRKAPRGVIEGGGHLVTLPTALSDRLRAVAQAERATLFMVALTLFRLVLARWSGRDDVRIGAPLSNRGRAESHGLVGYFATTVVLGGALDQRRSFGEALAATREELIAASENIDVPFDAVVEALRPPRIEGVHPLFQVKCTEHRAGGVSRFGGLPARARSLDAGEAHFDLSLDVVDSPRGVECHFAYARDVFEAVTVERLARDFESLAEAASAAPDRRLADLPLASDSGSRPTPSGALPPAEDVVDAWRRLAAAAPGMTAVVDGARAVTRGELERASDRLARRLVSLGAGPEKPVALDAERSAEWVLGLLAILKAGAAYVALDPAAPRARRAALLADSGARFVLTAPDRADDFGCERLTASFDDQSEEGVAVLPRAHPEQAAYLVYTSGSTGEPKGVEVTRAGLAHYVRGALDLLALGEGARLAMVSTVAADLGNTMLYGALCGGGELHLAEPARVLDPDAFAAWMTARRIDALKITPSHLLALLQGRSPAEMLPAEILVLGGEATGWDLVDRLRGLSPALRVVNHYGPTEATVGATRQRAEEGDRSAATLPIGAPFGAATALVLDRYLNPPPEGVPGELYIGGGSLARGYAGRPGQTGHRFVPDPSGVGARLYRTGDRVRRLASGALEFLGRVDQQVKIRGHRVEPGEVAAALRRIDGVADACVVATEENGAARLVAYVTGDKAPEVQELAARLGEALPGHMVPSHIVSLRALPLTSNGKIDHRALPHPDAPKPAGEGPRGEIEAALAAIWGDLLGVEAVGRHDGFIALGGDSILSLKMLARIRKQGVGEGGKRLSLADILNARSLAELAAHLAPTASVGRPDVVHLRRDGEGTPLFCVPGLIVNSTEFAPLAEALGPGRPILGFVSHVYTEARWRGYDVAALAAEYAAYIEEVSPGGRCALLGWSSGGDLAFETARRLKGRVSVEFLGLVDVFEPDQLRASTPLSTEERRQAEAMRSAWLARSAMAERWRALFERMSPAEGDGALRAILDRPDLPLDGPAAGSREADLWAQVDKRLRAAAHVHAPLPDQPVRVWQAEDSLSRPERLRDWSALAPVAELVRIPGAAHLDIILSPAFHQSVARSLSRV